jgi:hypothetical protein
VAAVLRYSRLAFPMHTALLPFPLVQEQGGRVYRTDFSGKGKARLAQIVEMRVNPMLFPDITPYRPLLAVRVEDFTLTFAPARITSL